MSDFEDRLRADGAAWREQVDAARPELTPRRARSHAWIGGVVAAALVIAMAVLVLALRHPSGPAHRTAAGERGTTSAGASSAASASSDPSAPVSAPVPVGVPQQAECPTGGSSSSGSGFSVSFVRGFRGEPTMQAAAAKFPPKNVTWTVAARSARSALLLSGSHYLHLVRLPGGGWAVDTGGDCGGATATVAK